MSAGAEEDNNQVVSSIAVLSKELHGHKYSGYLLVSYVAMWCYGVVQNRLYRISGMEWWKGILG